MSSSTTGVNITAVSVGRNSTVRRPSSGAGTKSLPCSSTVRRTVSGAPSAAFGRRSVHVAPASVSCSNTWPPFAARDGPVSVTVGTSFSITVTWASASIVPERASHTVNRSSPSSSASSSTAISNVALRCPGTTVTMPVEAR